MFKMLIGGKLVDGAAHLDVVSPVDEKLIAHAPDASGAEVDSAVAAAEAAFPAWAGISQAARQTCLRAMAVKVSQHAEELCTLLVRETGRPVGVGQLEVDLVRQALEYFSKQSLEVDIRFDEPNRRVEVHHKPLGVVAGIVPWNAPLYTAIATIAPALLVGNTTVIKPAPSTPLATLKLGEILADSVPAGVLNIISGGAEAGSALVTHRDVVKIDFTGSTRTGRAIMAAAAPGLKRLNLELGGNDPAIVLADADPRAIAPALFGLSFFNSGQVCAIIKRLYVHDSIYDAMCDELGALARTAIVGDGADPVTQFGPVQNLAQYEKVLTFLADARAHGRIIAGGEPLPRPGYFVPLTVVRDIAEGSATVDEEPFGPVLPIIRYSDVDEVVERANRSPYALGASVWSSNVEQATQIAKRLHSGSVWINQHCVLDPGVPFPANKQSGSGVAWGQEGLLAYTALQVININKG